MPTLQGQLLVPPRPLGRWTCLPLPLSLRHLSLIAEPAALPQILEPAPVVGPATTRTPHPPQPLSDRLQHASLHGQPGRQSARPPKPSGAHVPSNVGVLVRPSLTRPLGLLGRLRTGIPPLASSQGFSPTRRPPQDPPPGAHEPLPGSSHHGTLTSRSRAKAGFLVAGPTVLPRATRHKGQLSAGQPLPHLVRAGSAQHQQPLVPGGHERSLSASQNRRSEAIRRSDLGRRRKLRLGSNPTSSALLVCCLRWSERVPPRQ
jgi:hypothetical protein